MHRQTFSDTHHHMTATINTVGKGNLLVSLIQ